MYSLMNSIISNTNSKKAGAFSNLGSSGLLFVYGSCTQLIFRLNLGRQFCFSLGAFVILLHHGQQTAGHSFNRIIRDIHVAAFQRDLFYTMTVTSSSKGKLFRLIKGNIIRLGPTCKSAPCCIRNTLRFAKLFTIALVRVK